MLAPVASEVGPVFKVTGWGIVVLRCAVTLKPDWILEQLQQIWLPLSYIVINCW